MKRVLSICGALAVIALAMPCQAAVSTPPNGAGAITIDGVNPTQFSISMNQLKFGLGSFVSGKLTITSLFGPFRGLVNASTTSIEYAKAGPNSAVVHCGQFWFSDLTNWVPGYSSGIKYYWATADVTVIAQPDGSYSFGFTINRADNHAVVAAIPPMQVATGALVMK